MSLNLAKTEAMKILESLHNEGVCPFDFPAQLTDIDFGEVVPHNSENIFYFY